MWLVFSEKVLCEESAFCVYHNFAKHWTAKYRSVRIFQDNCNTRHRAFQLYHVWTSSKFIICLHVMSNYLALLKPVVNIFLETEQKFFCLKNILTRSRNFFKIIEKMLRNIFTASWNLLKKIQTKYGRCNCLVRTLE